MRTGSTRRSGRQPMVDKQRAFAKLLAQGVSMSEACRRLGIDRKTGHWWKNGGRMKRSDGRVRVVEPVVGTVEPTVECGRYLSEDERVRIADGVHAGLSARAIARQLGRAVTTITREVARNKARDGNYQPHHAHALMRQRRPRPKARRIETDAALRAMVQHYLDLHWSPQQISHELASTHGHHLAVETIYQALYAPSCPLSRTAGMVLRTKRPHRRPRRRGDQRRPRFIVPITPIAQRPLEVRDRLVPGHWEGDCIVGAYNRSAIATLVERTSRYTILLKLDGASRSIALRDTLVRAFEAIPQQLCKSLTWDQGSEMSLHHDVKVLTGMPVYFCDPGRPWQRPTNENTNGLLRDYFPKGTDLRAHGQDHLARVANELNHRPRRTLDWKTPQDLFTTLRVTDV